MSNIVETINKSIKGQVKNAVKDAGFNRIRSAQIVGKATSTDIKTSPSRYKVKIDGGEYDNVPVYGCASFRKGDTCKVVLPNNQTNQMFILGVDVFPIGGVYMNTNKANPSELFYGTWTMMGTLTIGSQLVYAWQRTS